MELNLMLDCCRILNHMFKLIRFYIVHIKLGCKCANQILPSCPHKCGYIIIAIEFSYRLFYEPYSFIFFILIKPSVILNPD